MLLLKYLALHGVIFMHNFSTKLNVISIKFIAIFYSLSCIIIEGTKFYLQVSKVIILAWESLKLHSDTTSVK